MSPRAAGILLHPTSLPGRFPIGDLGPEADAFVDFLASAGQTLWQVLPLGPTGHHDSPYGSLSCFAGSPLLVSPDRLVEDGLLPAGALDAAPSSSPEDRVDFETVAPWKDRLLRASWAYASRQEPEGFRDALESFVSSPLQRSWLPDWTLFRALSGRHPARLWSAWGEDLARREPTALETARRELAEEIAFQEYVQYLFFSQWGRVKARANGLGVSIFGDVPIYPSLHCADVWAHQDLFALDERGRPELVAGVPPDAFSDTGQLWGNPLYRWDRLHDQGFAWWVARIGMAFRLADVVRLDHFRGFAAYWEVRAGEPTALHGRWENGPGLPLFDAIREAWGDLALVAEDLGVITEDVRELLAKTGLPGMKVLQFAFSERQSDHLPHHHRERSVVFTGTHDNDTIRGWFAGLGRAERNRVFDYLGTDGSGIEWDLVRAAYTSVAERAIAPMQDVLGLGSEARMNLPGRSEGNWRWRMRKGAVRPAIARRLRRLAEVSGRLPVSATSDSSPEIDGPEVAG